MPTLYSGTGTTQVTTTTIRPVHSSWGLGVGKPHTTQSGFFLGVFLRSLPHPTDRGFIDFFLSRLLDFM